MSAIHKLISVSDVVESLRFEYDQYVIFHMTRIGPRHAMSTEFNHHPVLEALVTEVMTNGLDEKTASTRVVKCLTEQGVDTFYASKMAMTGLKQLVTSIGIALPEVTFGMIENGDMAVCNESDLHITYRTD